MFSFGTKAKTLNLLQEILRVHGKAARALANQTVPYSVCGILKDQEIYNPSHFTKETKEENLVDKKDVRSRYNGRLFLSWLQDVDDKWEKIKVNLSLAIFDKKGFNFHFRNKWF